MKPFTDIKTPEERKLSGGKARNLCELVQNGFPVPEGFVFFPNDLKSKAQLITDIETALRELKGLGFSKFAIRSSANFEDSAQSSFAGIFESVLNVSNVTEVLKAIENCTGVFFRVYFPISVKVRIISVKMLNNFVGQDKSVSIFI